MSDTIFFSIIMLTCLVVIGAVIFYASSLRKFDERQELIRTRAYKYGFSTMALVGAVMLFLSNFIKIPVSLAIIIPLFAGLLAMSIYDIFNSAYFGFNEKRAKADGWISVVWGIWIALNPLTEGERLLSEREIACLVIGISLTLTGLMELYQLHREHEKDED